MRISELLQNKPQTNPTEIVTCSTENTVAEAIDTMSRNNIGAVVVLRGDNVAGIFTERDVIQGIHEQGSGFLQQPLDTNMITDVIVVNPSQSLDEALEQMNDNKIRHLPVVEGNRLVGVLSIRDLIVQKLHRVKTTAEFLQQQVQLGSKPLPM